MRTQLLRIPGEERKFRRRRIAAFMPICSRERERAASQAVSPEGDSAVGVEVEVARGVAVGVSGFVAGDVMVGVGGEAVETGSVVVSGESKGMTVERGFDPVVAEGGMEPVGASSVGTGSDP
jgi:hypothetical protein